MKKSKKGFMFEMLGMLLAVMLWCFPMEVSAEEEYVRPYNLKAHTTYDIAEDTFIVDLTLETEKDWYLAYYIGEYGTQFDSYSAFNDAVFVEGKTASIVVESDYDNSGYKFWVVDENHNFVYDAAPMAGEEELWEPSSMGSFWHVFYHNGAGKYYLDEEFAETVEFVNGEDFSEHEFDTKFENGKLTVTLPEIDNYGDLRFKSYRNGNIGSNGSGGGLYPGIEKNGDFCVDCSMFIEESGEYSFVYWLEGEGFRSKNQFVSYTYEQPEQKVSAPTSIKWDTETYRTCTYTLPEQVENIGYALVELEMKYNEYGFSPVLTNYVGINYGMEPIADFSYEIERYMQIFENVVFRVAIRSISGDIESYTHSDWIYSDEYDPSTMKTAEEQVRAFVERMYTVALGRESDPSGIDYWANQLLTHQADGASLSEGFILSEEFAEKNYSNAEYLEVLYKTFFNREADEGGIAHWTSQMESGKSRRSVLAGFVNSNEFDELCTSYGIDRGTMTEDEPSGEVPAEGGVEQFVERLYTVCLERASEPAGLAEWTRRINAGESTPEEVAKFFFMSDEYVEKNTSNEKYIETLYLTFMDRTAEAGGKAYWVEQLNQGVSREVALSGFAQSPEFQEIMDRYGL